MKTTTSTGVSPAVWRLIDGLSKWYTRDYLFRILNVAMDIKCERGGRIVTRADWDKALERLAQEAN